MLSKLKTLALQVRSGWGSNLANCIVFQQENVITSLPDELRKLSALKVLDLRHNKLKEVFHPYVCISVCVCLCVCPV